MTGSHNEQREPFLDEVLGDFSGAEQAAVKQWFRQLESDPADGETTRLSARGELLSKTGSEPYRYAPFFSRISGLFEMPEAEVETLMTDIAWQTAPLRGIRFVDVETSLSRPGVDAGLVEFAPGVHYPRHVHAEREQVLILAGGYTDDEGKHWCAGDVHEMEPGTAHEFWTDDTGCVMASISDSRITWTSPWLRFLTVLARLIKR